MSETSLKENKFAKYLQDDPDFQEAVQENNSYNEQQNQQPPPPAPNRNNPMRYDSNHWSRLLNNAKHLAPWTQKYLIAMHNAGVRLAERKSDGKLVFLPGNKDGWLNSANGTPGEQLKAIMTMMYNAMLTMPAHQDNSPAFPAIEQAIHAGAVVVPCKPGEKGINGFRLDWSGSKSQQAVAEARAELDKVGGEVMKYLGRLGDDVRKMGAVIGLTAWMEVVDAGEFEWGDNGRGEAAFG